MRPTSLLFAAGLASAAAFAPPSTGIIRQQALSASALGMSKGFGKQEAPKREVSEGAKKRAAESSKYDDISSTGGQEYNVFLRQFGSDDSSWLPCGAIAVPRGGQVSDAIFANEADLKKAIVRTYPKLKGDEDEFEFGFNLRVYPDDPVEVANKGGGKSNGPSIGNWISNVLSPVDNSQVKPQN
mmetsp:Transcript_33917/g.99958  ORF Transcript_33917/g.99958 Transcript_33917/m.99958 type:complete len:184 (-) Transcript_33917:99-650(-)